MTEIKPIKTKAQIDGRQVVQVLEKLEQLERGSQKSRGSKPHSQAKKGAEPELEPNQIKEERIGLDNQPESRPLMDPDELEELEEKAWKS